MGRLKHIKETNRQNMALMPNGLKGNLMQALCTCSRGCQIDAVCLNLSESTAVLALSRNAGQTPSPAMTMDYMCAAPASG